jgi:hypothetical protein
MSTEKFDSNPNPNTNFGGSNPNSGFGGSNPGQGPDELPGILMVVSFCAPIVGLILWAMNKDQFPRKGKKALTAVIAGFVFYMVLKIIISVLNAAL